MAVFKFKANESLLNVYFHLPIILWKIYCKNLNKILYILTLPILFIASAIYLAFLAVYVIYVPLSFAQDVETLEDIENKFLLVMAIIAKLVLYLPSLAFILFAYIPLVIIGAIVEIVSYPCARVADPEIREEENKEREEAIRQIENGSFLFTEDMLLSFVNEKYRKDVLALKFSNPKLYCDMRNDVKLKYVKRYVGSLRVKEQEEAERKEKAYREIEENRFLCSEEKLIKRIGEEFRNEIIELKQTDPETYCEIRRDKNCAAQYAEMLRKKKSNTEKESN